MTDGAPRYYGLYRGTVINNIDPMQHGRIQVIVPVLWLVTLTMALPKGCVIAPL